MIDEHLISEGQRVFALPKLRYTVPKLVKDCTP